MQIHQVDRNWILSASLVFSSRVCGIYVGQSDIWKSSALEFTEIRYKVMKETELFVTL
jgi:hypothetical protein